MQKTNTSFWLPNLKFITRQKEEQEEELAVQLAAGQKAENFDNI